MAVTVVVAVVVLAALFVVILVVTMQIHREERAYLRERRYLTVRDIPLTRPAHSRSAQFARSVCGVYIKGLCEERAPQLPGDEALAWYERTRGPSWS
jgi:hypothetical protein